MSVVSLCNHPGPLTHEGMLVCRDHNGAKAVAIEFVAERTGHDDVEGGAVHARRSLRVRSPPHRR